MIKNNIQQFIPYLDEIDELNKAIINSEINLAAIAYLKEHQIIYNENVPIVALNDREYVLMCIQQEPTLMGAIGEIIYLPLNEYPEITKKIADKIETEQIKFAEIPYIFQKCKDIYQSIIKINPILLQEGQNRIGLDIITREMTEQQVLDYYKTIGYPFNASTVQDGNFGIILECLKNDYMTLANSNVQFTVEQYKQIYDVLKDNIKPEEVLSSKFLTRNPYFVMDLLSKDINLDGVDLLETRAYDEMYSKIKTVAIKLGKDIPEPKKQTDVIKFKGNNVFVNLDDIENVKKGLQYLSDNGIDQALNIEMAQGDFNEFIITDNLEYFENLLENGVNINFKYNNGKKSFSLREIMRMEHFMQGVAEDIKSKNLSPLEQLIAVYDIAKVFKPYEHGEANYNADSRSLYEYLDNEYMVCAGYADLIVNLGHRINAPYADIGLDIRDTKGSTTGIHGRNYVNLIDEKYGINGFYVLDPTWEHGGQLGRGLLEEYRSKYENFLLTTQEGRTNAEPGETIDYISNNMGGYDKLLTMQTPEEIREYFANENYYSEKWFKRISMLDPEFYKKMVTLDFSKDEDAQVLIDYFNTKVNNPVPKEKMLDAIMQVKKSVYVNFTEQDFEDMKMGYSITEPFCFNTGFLKKESLYGDEYIKYMQNRYEDIKSKTMEEAQQENRCLDIRSVYQLKMSEELLSVINLGQLKSDGRIEITDESLIELIEKNKEKFEDIGFVSDSIKIGYGDEDEKYSLKPVINKRKDLEKPLEQRIIELKKKMEKIFESLNISYEISTKGLGQQTLEEQTDTTGKIETLDEIQRQMEEPIKEENNQETK